MNVAIIGCGYVGLVTAASLSEIGHDVTCVEIDQDKLLNLQSGRSTIYEPGLEEILQKNKDRLKFVGNYRDIVGDIKVTFITVGTPICRNSGGADLTILFDAVNDLKSCLIDGQIVVIKSTVPVGTCDKVAEILDKAIVISNPEFLKEGTAINDCLHPDRIILGIDEDEGLNTMVQLYKPFVIDNPSKFIVMDRRSSELSKYACNAMLATRISFMNEMSVLCERYGADIDKVRQGMGSDNRIGNKFLYAGPGYGGSCFPKDVSALVNMGKDVGEDLSVIKSVIVRNVSQKNRIARKVLNYFPIMNFKKIVVWGLAFKPGTDDVRESPALSFVRICLAQGAHVVVHDPKAMASFAAKFGQHDRLTFAENAYSGLYGADCLVLLTEWAEYKRPNWELVSQAMFHKAIFDFRNQWEYDELKRFNFYYECIGRPGSNTREYSNADRTRLIAKLD